MKTLNQQVVTGGSAGKSNQEQARENIKLMQARYNNGKTREKLHFSLIGSKGKIWAFIDYSTIH